MGWHGLAQTLMDVLKLLTKEDITPPACRQGAVLHRSGSRVHPVAHGVRRDPVLAHVEDHRSRHRAALHVRRAVARPDRPAHGGLGVRRTSGRCSAVCAAAAQQIAYEVPLLLAVLPIVMIAGSLNLGEIVEAQAGYVLGFIPKWFIIWQFPAFLLFLIAGLVELNQTPFDLSEAESELVAGFASEYSAMKFGLLFLAEFSDLFIMSALDRHALLRRMA